VQTQSSPLAQRVQFLEAKGLTSSEIEEAMRQAGSNQSASYVLAPQYAAYPPVYGNSPYAAQPPQPWDWRDYFVSFSYVHTVDLKIIVRLPLSFLER
jgi:peroxin-14